MSKRYYRNELVYILFDSKTLAVNSIKTLYGISCFFSIVVMTNDYQNNKTLYGVRSSLNH